MVVPSYNSDCAGLRSFLTELLDEADLGADAKVLESSVQNTVLVEKNLTAIARFEKAVACLGEQPNHAGASRVFVGLDEPTATVDGVLDLLLHFVEGSLDHRKEISTGRGSR